MKPALRILIVFLLCVMNYSAVAQEIEPEYGDFPEIQGKHKIFLRCDDIEYRKEIIKQIEEYVSKGKVEAQIVGREEDSEIIIAYWNAGAKSQFGGYKKIGDLVVAIGGKDVENTAQSVGGQKQRMRIIYSARGSKSYNNYGIGHGKSPAKSAIRKFLDDWSKFQKTARKEIK